MDFVIDQSLLYGREVVTYLNTFLSGPKFQNMKEVSVALTTIDLKEST